MSWTVQSAKPSKATGQLFAFVCKGHNKLIARFSTDSSLSECIVSRILFLFSTTESGKIDGQHEEGKALIIATIESFEIKGVFSIADLQTESVLQVQSVDGTISANLVHETESFSCFCSLLRSPKTIISIDDEQNVFDLPNKVISFEELVYEKPLASWRMTSSKVALSSSPGGEYVFKGFNFYHFLVTGVDGFRTEVAACYREIQMVNYIIPPHPNITPPAQFLVCVNSTDEKDRLIIGSIYVYLQRGSLADLLDKTAREKTRLPLGLKAKWCYQLCLGMAHVHFVARNWHQDIKPPNVLLDSDQNVRIIDWEQCGANPFIMAPEIDGTWDAVELDQEVNGRRQIAYHRYEGPKRVNQAVEPHWNSHPDWNQNCPRASELAEVFSLGRTMWIILEQIGLERTVGVTDYSTVVIQWSRWSDDIPAPWKHMVELSMAHNPNDRPLMNELLGFWEKELQGHRLSS